MILFSVPELLPFGVAIIAMIVLALIDGLGIFIATSPSQLIDDFIPDAPESLGGVLAWLHVGRVPLLALIALFLFGFSTSGYAIQIFVLELTGAYLPSWVAVAPAVLVGFSAVRAFGGVLAHILPNSKAALLNEQKNEQNLLGRAGVVIGGTARAGLAAEVRLYDQNGNAHYLMVEPDLPEEEFTQGMQVLIVKKIGTVYRGIRNPHPALL